MPGMNNGLDPNDPTVVAAFRSALLHQGLIALLIFAVLSVAWVSVRAQPDGSREEATKPHVTRSPGSAPGSGPTASRPGGRCCGSASACCGWPTRSC